MAFDIIKFYESYKIPYATSGTKHTRKGWVNTRCPFCSSSSHSYHLGVHITGGAVKCWKCGKHSQIDIIKKVLNCDWERALEVHNKFGGTSKGKVREKKSRRTKRMAAQCKFPPGTIPMQARHKKYLLERKFEPDTLIELWDLKATEALGEYKWRIIAPIMFDGIMVSYQGRDITNKSKLKYKACPKEKEVMEHQHIVYGLDHVKGDSCVIVEGITDVWRLGYGAVSCFGTSFTTQQVNLIAERMKTVFVLFDGGEEDSAKMARELGVMLSARGIEVENLILERGDPGEMPQEEADLLMEELGF